MICNSDRAQVHMKDLGIEVGLSKKAFQEALEGKASSAQSLAGQALSNVVAEFQHNGMNYENTASPEELGALNEVVFEQNGSPFFAEYKEKAYRYSAPNPLIKLNNP